MEIIAVYLLVNGCQDMFCARHVNQHREDLNNQFELVVHEYNLSREQLRQSSSDHMLLKEIDNWEKINSKSSRNSSQICGPIQLDRAHICSKYIGNNWEYGRIRGYQKYSQGRSMIRFKIEKSKSSEQLFRYYNIKCKFRSTMGWCRDNNIWQHGCHDQLINQTVNDKFQMGDILQIILNCNQEQIELYNERTDTKHILHVNMNQTPFPWQFFVFK